MDAYLANAELLVRQGKAKLESISASLRSEAPAFSVLARRRKLTRFEARYAEVSRRFEELRRAGSSGIAELKVTLEKAMETFQAEIGGRP